MRITQNMLMRNNLNYISNNYERYGDLLDQINSQKKITRPSQDPVIAIKGMSYRSQVVEVEQFERNLSEVHSWMDNADATLSDTTQVLHRIKELITQASNETYTPDQRNGIAKEISELQNHLQSLANTKINNKYIFNGTNTNSKPVDISQIGFNIADLNGMDAQTQKDLIVNYQGKQFTFDNAPTPIINGPTTDGNGVTTEETTRTYVFKNGNEEITLTHKLTEITKAGVTSTKEDESVTFNIDSSDPSKAVSITSGDIVISNKNAISTNQQDLEIEVMKGININVNIRPQNVFSAEMFKDTADLIKALKEPNQKATDINAFLSKFEKHFDNVTAERSDLGARFNRVELIEERLGQQDLIARKTMSENEDIDFEKAVTDLKIQEMIHRSALAVGARIIQPTLMDFLR